MRRIFVYLCCTLFCSVGAALAQQPLPKAILGTISEFKAESAEVIVKPDNTAAVTVKITADTVFQRVAPGERDLKKATPLKMTDMAIGDRVLVSFNQGTTEALRIVVMSATDITKRNEADRLDWQKRGIAGVVKAKNGNEITLGLRGMTGQVTATVTVNEKTAYRRYAADSVKFADAQISKLDDIAVGDQVRARGVKSDDGSKVTAEEVVFGTFVTRAGTITAVDPATNQITVTEVGTNAPLTIKITADSQLKKMPDMAAMFGQGGPGAGGPGGGRGPGGPPAGGPPSGAPGAGSGGPGGPGAGRMPDVGQMIERMPAAKIDDLKPGEKVIVSSTKGAKADQVTAITLLGNAGMILQMASMQGAQGGQRPVGAPGAAGGAMGMGGLQGLEIPSIVP